MQGWPGLNAAEWDDADLVAAIGDYQPDDLFCCCLAAQPEIVAIDLDLVDHENAAFADRLADNILGRTPLVRIGLAPKRIRVYRNSGGIHSRKLHPLEIFSGTGQFIAFGWHEKAGRPYLWPDASPLTISADSDAIPLVTPSQLNHFSTELFKVVPRRLLPTRQGGRSSAQTIGERLNMLTTLHGSWRRAAAIVLGEAVEGCRNDIAWSVIASAAGRGIPEDIVWELFERHFCGWDGISEAQVASMMERARPVRQTFAMTFTPLASAGGVNGS